MSILKIKILQYVNIRILKYVNDNNTYPDVSNIY